MLKYHLNYSGVIALMTSCDSLVLVGGNPSMLHNKQLHSTLNQLLKKDIFHPEVCPNKCIIFKSLFMYKSALTEEIISKKTLRSHSL